MPKRPNCDIGNYSFNVTAIVAGLILNAQGRVWRVWKWQSSYPRSIQSFTTVLKLSELVTWAQNPIQKKDDDKYSLKQKIGFLVQTLVWCNFTWAYTALSILAVLPQMYYLYQGADCYIWVAIGRKLQCLQEICHCCTVVMAIYFIFVII